MTNLISMSIMFKNIWYKLKKAYRYLKIAAEKRIRLEKSNILLMIGADPNGELKIVYPGYKKCIVFEAYPKRFEELKKKYRNCDNVLLYNYAVADYNGEIEFNISSNNNGASSSLGTFSGEWQGRSSKTAVSIKKKIKVPCINLYEFCKKHNIEYIDDYVSDIQGMDLEVLKTMEPFIAEGKIGSIKCEVTKDKYGNIYEGLPDNSESGFHELLNKNYKLVSKGFGLLEDNNFEEIPEEVWEMDCKWKLKKE